jgi:uncharacterized protein (TIGR03435 family)
MGRFCFGAPETTRAKGHFSDGLLGEPRVKYCGRIQVRASGRKSVIDTFGSTLPEFAGLLTQDAGRDVSDETGLSGMYDLHLEYVRDDLQPGRGNAGNSGPSLFTALEEQLGLKLVSAKGRIEYLVIDRAEKPSEN